MKKCKYCQSEIDQKANVCPVCKRKLNSSTAGIIIIIVAVLVIVGIVFGVRNDAESTKGMMEKISENGSRGQSEWLNSKADLELEDGYTGKMDDIGLAYYIEGYVKNNSSKEFSYVQITFTTYDKEGNTIGTCLDNNSGLEANGRWKFKAMCLDDVKNINSFKLKEITKY